MVSSQQMQVPALGTECVRYPNQGRADFCDRGPDRPAVIARVQQLVEPKNDS
jgi:hypothetical protein